MAQKKELDRFEKNAKRGIQIQTKLLGIILGSVVGVSLGVLALTTVIFNNGIVTGTEHGLDFTATGVTNMLALQEQMLKGFASGIADNPTVQQAVSDEDTSMLRNLLPSLAGDMGVDFVALVGRHKTVLNGGGYNVKEGANVGSCDAVVTASRGSAVTEYNEFDNFSYAQIAAVPIRYGTAIVGCAVVGFDLTTEKLTKQVQAAYNVESTVFKGNTRVATTLGRNMVGTQISNTAVSNQVLGSGATFKDRQK